MRVIVLLGAPGSGKGTQAAVLSSELGLPHVATGDLFRAAVRDGSPIGLEAHRYMERGQLVPDDITVRMLLGRLAEDDAAAGVLLDGFPRNRDQAVVLDEALAERGERVGLALEIAVGADDVVDRLSSRRVCEASGHVYNERTNPPREPGVCDLDGSALVQREDDRAETIRARLDVQLASLADVIAHYRDAGVLRTVDGNQPIDAVSEGLLAAIAADDAAG